MDTVNRDQPTPTGAIEEQNMTLYKTTRFDMIEPGVSFQMTDWTEKGRPVETFYVKTSTRKAALPEDICGTLTPVSEFAVKPSARVTIKDVAAMDAEAAFLAKPLFDGTEASCIKRSDFYALDAAHRDVVNATEKLDEMADYITRKMEDVKRNLRRVGTVELEQKDRYSPKFNIAPASITAYSGLNSCGELQGNGNLDMLVATLIAKRETFIALVQALGYRLTEKAAS